MDFQEIANSNIPFVQAELIKAPSLTGTIKQEYTALIFGQKTATGTADANVILDIFSEAEAQGKFGRTSMLAHAAKRWFDNNKGVKLKMICLDDEGTGTQATGTITVSGTATSNGTFAAYINGRAYRIAVSIGDTATDIATLLVSKVTEDLNSQVTATSALGAVTFTAVHKGTYGNTLKIKVNYNNDDEFPSSVSAVIVAMAGGAGDPDLETTGIISILEENQFNLIAQPYTDNANLTLIDTALTDNFKATEMLDSFCVVAVDDTVSNLTTKSDTLNTAFITICDNNSVFSTGLEQAAAMIAVVSDIGQSSPGSGYLNKELAGLLPLAQRLRTERNVLAGGGIATLKTQGTSLLIERTVTTLQKDANNIPTDVDDTDLRVFLTISYVRYTFIVRMSQYQGYKLGGDNDRFGAGIRVMTPNLYRQNLILNYKQLVTDAVCEDQAGFEDSIVVQKNGNRLDSQFQINVINILLQQAMQIKYEV